MLPRSETRPVEAASDAGGSVVVERASSARLCTLTARADFLKAARALRQNTPGFLLQARPRGVQGCDAIRVGFTCSKKVGNAVARNRAKRRLRALAREVLPRQGAPGWDYVLIGRQTVTAEHDFAAMRRDLGDALRAVHRKAGA